MQEKNKKHILRLSALILTLLHVLPILYILPIGYVSGLGPGVIDGMAIFLLLMLLIAKKSYHVALNIIIFYAGLTVIHILYHVWILIDFLKTSY